MGKKLNKTTLKELTHEELDIFIRILARNGINLKDNDITAQIPKRATGGVVYSVTYNIPKKMFKRGD